MFPYSGITQTLGGLLFVYLSYRFFRIYRLEKYLVGKLFTYVFLFFSFVYFALGIPALFFIKNQTVWSATSIASCIFQSLVGAVVGSLIFYLKFPHLPSRLGFYLALIIELALVAPSIIHPAVYFFEPSGVVNWKINPLFGFMRYLGVLLFLIPIGIIFLGQAITSKDRRTKIRAYGIGIGAIFAIIVYLIDFLLLSLTKIDAKWTDMFLGFMFLGVFVALVLTRKGIKSLPFEEQK